MNAREDAQRFADLLRGVGELYDVTVSPARSALYFGALIRFDFEIVSLAFSKFLQTEASKFGFPKPAHIVEIIEGSQSEQEENAWLAVNDAIRKIGAWSSLIVADPALSDAIVRTFGSWVRCCEESNESNNFVWDTRRRAFIMAYRLARKIERPKAEHVLLGGRSELHNRGLGKFPARQPYGAILLDGKVESRYLDINEQSGLPAVRLGDALALPEGRPRLLLAERNEPETGTELVGDAARYTLEEAFAKLMRERTFPESSDERQRVPFRHNPITPEEQREIDRRAFLRRQALEDGQTNSTPEASVAVRAREATNAERADRTSNHGGGTPESGDGVRVREIHREELAGGLRVAGMEDSVRTGGRSVRKRGELRSGQLDDTQGKRSKNTRDVRQVGNRKTRRKT